MGCGDWNDGMNLVGHEGKGESVWLAFFLYDVLMQFAGLAQRRTDLAFAEFCTLQAQQLSIISKNTAGTANGTAAPILTTANRSGRRPIRNARLIHCPKAGRSSPEPAILALASGDAVVEQRLVHRDCGLIKLLSHPSTSPLEPGYIKGYIPGVRENGGQYTHGAIWTAMAFALMGEISAHGSSSRCSIPSITARHASRSHLQGRAIRRLGDIYAAAPHMGRGGWTWYTGSAGWMYRLLIETLLGITRKKNQLHIIRPFLTSGAGSNFLTVIIKPFITSSSNDPMSNRSCHARRFPHSNSVDSAGQ